MSSMRHYRQTILAILSFCALLALTATLIRQRRNSNGLDNTKYPINVPQPGTVQLAMVIPKTKFEDVSWAYEMRPRWTPYVYTMEKKPEVGYILRPPVAEGREAMAYLTFIIDYYYNLPNITAFIHASREQHHNVDLGPSTETYLRSLRLDTVIRDGYVNLRCETQPNCPIGINPLNPTETDIRNKDTRAYFAEIYTQLFNVELSAVPEHVGGVCCAQFVVSRDQIRKRPLRDYIRMQDWLITTKQTDDFGKGWVFENIWHIVFDKDAIHCPSQGQCKCDAFGVCDSPADT